MPAAGVRRPSVGFSARRTGAIDPNPPAAIRSRVAGALCKRPLADFLEQCRFRCKRPLLDRCRWYWRTAAKRLHIKTATVRDRPGAGVRTQTTRRRRCYAPPRRRYGRPLAWRLRCPVWRRSLSVVDHSRPNSESRLSPPRGTNGPHAWLDSRCLTYGMSAAGSPRQGYRCKFRWRRSRVPAIPVSLTGCSTLLLERVLYCAFDSPEILHLFSGKRVAHA